LKRPTALALLLLACIGALGVAGKQDAPMAFGRAEYLRNGNHLLTLYVRSIPAGSLQLLGIEQEGSFYWPLPSGEYQIVGYELKRRDAPHGMLTGRLMTSFSVPREGQAVYIGDLEIGPDSDPQGFRILHNYVEALKRAESRVNHLQPVNAVMRREPRMVGDERTAAAWGAAWKLDCGGRHAAVTLPGQLAWKPSARPDVAYDVAVFEALKLGGLINPRILRGELVAYAEGLHEARYSPSASLHPGRMYEWTVRLRDRDAVSRWSASTNPCLVN
jgi:hypothetical protein